MSEKGISCFYKTSRRGWGCKSYIPRERILPTLDFGSTSCMFYWRTNGSLSKFILTRWLLILYIEGSTEGSDGVWVKKYNILWRSLSQTVVLLVIEYKKKKCYTKLNSISSYRRCDVTSQHFLAFVLPTIGVEDISLKIHLEYNHSVENVNNVENYSLKHFHGENFLRGEFFLGGIFVLF